MRPWHHRATRARLALTTLLTAGGLVVMAPAAWAHGRAGDATNFDSEVVRAPRLPGVRWQVEGADEFLSVRNTSQEEVVVLDYEGRPYLRLGPDGAWRNRNSEAAYLNRDRYAATPVPADVDPAAPPDWERISDEPAALWHDHRIHWMAPTLPPQVEQARGQVMTVQGWEVPFTYAGEPHRVTGRLTWVPPPAVWPWLAGALLVTALPVLTAARTPPRGRRWPGLARPAAVVLLSVALLNLTDAANDVAALPLPLTTELVAAAQTALFIGLGALGALRAWRGDHAGFTALVIGSVGLLLGQGLLAMEALTSSQVVSVFPEALTRMTVALSLVQLAPVGLAAAFGVRRLSPSTNPALEETVPAAME